MALLLVYDLLISSNGLALSRDHILRKTVARHKARLNAELTRIRLKKGHPNLQAFRAALSSEPSNGSILDVDSDGLKSTSCTTVLHPRWVRVNTLRTSLQEQLQSTFIDFKQVHDVQDLCLNSRTLYLDPVIPNLLGLPRTWQASSCPAYASGSLILQDKASCFPAILLDPKPGDVCLDACAAPGNKTSHLAALMGEHDAPVRSPRTWACERDRKRAEILRQMIHRAGAQKLVDIKAGQDFLSVEPDKCAQITHILLDPSCSGSGIIGRDDELLVALPSRSAQSDLNKPPRKRKRKKQTSVSPTPPEEVKPEVEHLASDAKLTARLTSLSNLQLKLLLHSFAFPSARRITYSTCSLHPEENEHVVIRALRNSNAKQHGWRLLRQEEQPASLRSWHIRGDQQACIAALGDDEDITAEEISAGCIRCEKGTKDGTQGFFVMAFVRDEHLPRTDLDSINGVFGDNQEWQGFDDGPGP